ncbi:MAG: gfo/Idh/MocA family oxidoreductase [Verrucomicrobia bacterium]|nr:gfo/Idh/MocA family oxidoreductase [Verrucomicrobiota bacterium]
MADRVGMGVVGCGAIGITAALEHLSQPDVQDRVFLAATCDPVPGRAEAAAKKYNVPAHYTSLDELLKNDTVTAVTICSPIGLHYEQGMKAIEAGKHVHFNKTMCTTAKEATELIKAAKRKKVRLVASPGQMIRPYNQRFRKLVKEGKLGQVIWASAACSMSHYHTNEKVRKGEGALGNIDPSWYYKKPAGGPVYDGTVYSLHSLTGLLGPAQRVTAMSGLVVKERFFNGNPIQCEMDDSTFFLIDFGNGLFAFSGGTVLGGVNEGFSPTVFGTLGTIKGFNFIPKKPAPAPGAFGDDDAPQLQDLPDDHQPHVVGPHATMREKHVFEDMMQLVDWIREKKPSIATAEHARHVIEIIEAAYKSAQTGKAQKLKTTFAPADF